MNDPEKLLPLSNDRMRCLIVNVVRMMRPSELHVPLWSIVGSITGHGSGYSCQICRDLGFLPEQRVDSNNHKFLYFK